MNTFLEKVSAWNKSYNDIPRRFALIIVTVLTCFLAAKVFPYCWPFVLAFIFSSLMEPVARVLRKLFRKVKAARSLATLLCMLVLFGLIISLVFVFADRIINEAVSFVASLPATAKTAYDTLTVWITELYEEYSHLLPDNFMEMVSSFLQGLYEDVLSIAKNLTGKIAVGTITTATSLPYVILAIVLTIMGTFYMSYDRERIAGYFRRTFPGHVVKKFGLIKDGVFSAIFGQIRAQLFISFVLMLIIISGLIIIGKPYALLMGVLIGIADALPVIGAGLFLNSWAVLDILFANYTSALGLFIIFLTCVVVRQTIEPRVVGKQLGLYPLVTMMSMFAGFKLIGVLGLIAGPIVANICRVVLDADAGRLSPEAKIPLKVWLRTLGSKLRKKPEGKAAD